MVHALKPSCIHLYWLALSLKPLSHQWERGVEAVCPFTGREALVTNTANNGAIVVVLAPFFTGNVEVPIILR